MRKITVAKGDRIGPEIMDATLKIILAAGANIETGGKVWLDGNCGCAVFESHQPSAIDPVTVSH